jgi:hypothetical protein
MAVGRSQQRGLGALGQWEAILGSVAKSFLGTESGGSGTMPGQSQTSRNEVSPTIITSVSPQISPVFQQQYQPTNSGLTATTTQGGQDAAMAALGVGNSGYPAGYPIAQPYASPTYSSVVPSDQIIAGIDNTTLAIAGLGLIWYMTQGKKSKGDKTKKVVA